MSPAPVDIEVKAVTDTTTIVDPDPLSIRGFAAWRKKGAVPLGVAAASSSDMFKSPSCFNNPKAKRWDREFSFNPRGLVQRVA